jgi:1-acyl-sn-glycerol-3-phosphate acyltransferase
MVFLRSLLFAAGMWLSTVLFAPFALLTFPFPLGFRYRFIRQWARFNLWWLGVSCGLRYRVEGSENIPETPAVVFCKHQSAWETLALQNVLPHQIWLLKRELLRIPFFGWGLAMLRPIAIDRRAGARAVTQVVEQGTRHLLEGRWVIIFPEGTRMAPGQSGRYGIGGAVLAERSGFPVLPIAHNAGEFWPRKGFIKRPGTITLSVGPLIPVRGKTAEQIRDEARGWIERRAAELHRSAQPFGS